MLFKKILKRLNKRSDTRKPGVFRQKNNFVLNEDSSFFSQEAYKMLRTNLIFSLPQKKCKKILITSSEMHEYKSTTAINLSIVLAEYGFRVLLMDCDLRLPSIADKLRLTGKEGLSDLLVGLTEKQKIIRHYRENLDILPSGTIPPNPSELLGSDAMEGLLEELESSYDYIIIDAAPAGSVTDAVIISKWVTGFVFVVRSGVARKDNIDRCLKMMQVTGAKMLGFVLTGNGRDRSSAGYNYRYKKN